MGQRHKPPDNSGPVILSRARKQKRNRHEFMTSPGCAVAPSPCQTLSCRAPPALGLGTVVRGCRLGRGSSMSSCLARGISTPGLGCGCEEKMAAAITLLFLLFVKQAWAQHGSMEVVGAVHGVAYLSPRLQKNITYYQFHWRRNNSVKIASWKNRIMAQYPNSTYKGRLELFSNMTLKISHLQKNDSSVYQVYLEDVTGKEHIESIVLNVYDLVPKPIVSAKVIRDDPESCEAILQCSAGLKGVTYEWSQPSKLPREGTSAPEQHVSFNPSTETYTCKVSNPVSSNTASLTYRHPCSWSGESSAAASCSTVSVLMALGHLLLLLFLLTVA